MIEIYYFPLPLALSENQAAILLAHLAHHEQDYVNKLPEHSPRRIQFLYCRSVLRRLLAQHLNCLPHAIAITTLSKGKPSLVPSPVEPHLQFNLSHSKTHGAVVISQSFEVGIDIESMCHRTHLDALAERVMTPAELHAFQALSEAERIVSFHRLWTQKEATVKALGMGLSIDLRAFTAGKMPLLFQEQPLTLIPLQAPQNHQGALAILGPEVAIETYPNLPFTMLD